MNTTYSSKKRGRAELIAAAVLFLLFLLLILALKTVDLQRNAPEFPPVGLAGLNFAARRLFGMLNPTWSRITDLLGVIVLITAGGFACLGFFQLFTRKSLRKVDTDLYLLAALYILTAMFYLFFEICVVNFRPVHINRKLEPSFPSSHTLLAISVMGSAIFQFKRRLRSRTARAIIIPVCAGILFMTVLGRALSGLHWFTDILGGILLGSALCLLYTGTVRLLCPQQKKHRAKRHIRTVPN